MEDYVEILYGEYLMDKHTKEQRRKNMQAIKSKDTGIEVSLRKALWHKGIRYRKNFGKLPGKPDIVLTKHRIAIFCDSEFWHGYEWETRKFRIKSRHEYWIPKIERNMARDQEINKALEELGWTVLRFWGFKIKKNLEECVSIVEQSITKQRQLN